MTATKAVIGSPLYMSPEQMKSARNVDARTDIWSLGVVLYETVAGAPPFDGETIADICVSVATGSTPALLEARGDIPRGFEAVIARCLEKDPAQRYQTVAELALALAPYAPERAQESVRRVCGTIQSAGLSGAGAALASTPAPSLEPRRGLNGGPFARMAGRRGRWSLGVAGGAVFAVLATGLWWRLGAGPPKVAAVVQAVPTRAEPRPAPPLPAAEPLAPVAPAARVPPTFPRRPRIPSVERRRPSRRPRRKAPSMIASDDSGPPLASRRARRLMFAGLLACAFGASRGAAAAGSDADRLLAQSLFDQAKQLMDAGRYGEACPKLAESQRLDPAGGTLLNLALCHEEEGRLATAWADFKEALGAARRAGRPDREQAARAHIAALEPRLARLTLEVRHPDPGLVVKIDGALVGGAAWNTATPVDPGWHEVIAAAPEKKPCSQRVEIQARQQTTLIILLSRTPQREPTRPCRSTWRRRFKTATVPRRKIGRGAPPPTSWAAPASARSPSEPTSAFELSPNATRAICSVRPTTAASATEPSSTTRPRRRLSAPTSQSARVWLGSALRRTCI